MMLEVRIPVRIKSGNVHLREHWRTRAKRVKRERHRTAFAWLTCPVTERIALKSLVAYGKCRFVVTLTRVAPQRITDEHDNLRAGFKAVVDELAHQLGIDDGDPRIRWNYAQAPGAYGVRAVIEAVD